MPRRVAQKVNNSPQAVIMLVSIKAIGGKKKAANRRKIPVNAKTIANHSYKSFWSKAPLLFMSKILIANLVTCSTSFLLRQAY